MSAVSGRLATMPRFPLRAVVAAALLLIALAVGLALLAGSQQPKVPAPFGLAKNGQIVFADADGAIRAGNAVDGTTVVIVAGNGNRQPVVSPDGTHIAYMRTNASHTTDLVAVDSQGRDPVVLASGGLLRDTYVGWTPDSRRVTAVMGAARLVAYELVAGGRPTTVLDAMSTNGLQNDLPNLFRPPAGDEVLELAFGRQGEGLYRRSLNGGEPIPVLTKSTTAVPFSNLASPQWSPDGRQVAFTLHPPENPDLGRVYVVNVDGTGLRRVSHLERPFRTIDEEHVTWSPDGTRVAFNRWISSSNSNDVRPVTIVDVATGAEHELKNVEVNGYNSWGWSPDGTSILQVPGEGSADNDTVLVVDATTGEVIKTGWSVSGAARWQRLQP
jgi:Tol biopolymer transport system component